jgi:hypothetical protein
MAVKQKPMTSAEVLEEVEWLMQNGMPIRDIPAAVGKSASAINKAAWRAGNSYVSKPFDALQQRIRREQGQK